MLDRITATSASPHRQRGLLAVILQSIALCIVSAAPITAGASPLSDDVATAVRELRAEHQIPALGAMVFTAEQHILAHSVDGTLRAGDRTPVQLDSLWHLGSNTKAMTATLAAVFVADEKISFESSVSDFLPSIRKDIHADAADITLAQLLNHTAGLPGNPPFDEKRRIVALGNDVVQQRLAAAKWTLGQKPLTTPGSSYQYSNLGYIIAGAMLEHAGRKSWEHLIRDHLFDPLDISSTAGFGPPQGRQPEGHRLDPADPSQLVSAGQLSDNPPFYAPAGTVHMNLSDWMRFGAAHLRGGRQLEKSQPQLPRLLSVEDYRTLHTPTAGAKDYAFGWGLYRTTPGSLPVLSHNGSNTEWYARVMLNRQAGIGILLVTNAANDPAKAAINALGKRISEALKAASARP